MFISIPVIPTLPSIPILLKRRVGINKQLLEIRLEPGPRLGRRLQRIRISTVGIVARAGAVRSAIALTTGLNPDKSIEQWVAGVSTGARTKARADDIAPVAPGLLLGGLHAVAAGVGDEVGWVAVLGEQRGESVDVQLLVVITVALCVGRRRGDGPGVVVGHVGGETAD